MLAETLNLKDQFINGWYCSIKFDGQRCFWDGGASRGVPKSQVPWANNKGDERYVESQIATGLWSRYGNVIHAPASFLDGLPPVMLDGELWLGRGMFQETRRVTSTIVPGAGWNKMRYMCFDMPTPLQFVQMGRINNPNFQLFIDENECLKFLRNKKVNIQVEAERFSKTVHKLFAICKGKATFAGQTRLSLSEAKAREELETLLMAETDVDGEGLVLRAPNSFWVPKRSKNLLKVKPFDDDEGVVIGYTSGKEGKLLGLMGNVIVRWKDKQFELSGFTDEERSFRSDEATRWCAGYPGKTVPAYIDHPSFPRGTQIRFRYRQLTEEGIPREARYWRG